MNNFKSTPVNTETEIAMSDKPDMDERPEQRVYNGYDYAFVSGFRCGIDCMQRELEEEMRREAETFNRFVGLKNRTHELANMLWAAIKTIDDRDTRISVMNEVRAGFDRLEARDRATKAKR